MSSYTTTEALYMILNSTDFDSEDDPDSGDESDIREDPRFPLGGSGDKFAEGERNESKEEGQRGDTAAEDGSDSDQEGKVVQFLCGETLRIRIQTPSPYSFNSPRWSWKRDRCHWRTGYIWRPEYEWRLRHLWAWYQ